MANVGGNFARRGLLWKIEATADIRNAKIVERELPGIIHEMREGIVARVDGPDDLIERFDELPGSGRDFADVLAGFLRCRAVLLGQFAEQRDLGEIRAEVVMDVLRDTRAFLM